MVAIGPALETFITVLLLLLAALGALALLLRPAWKRLYRYLTAWYLRDLQQEEEQKREAEQRKKAEQELRQLLHEEEGSSPKKPDSRKETE